MKNSERDSRLAIRNFLSAAHPRAEFAANRRRDATQRGAAGRGEVGAQRGKSSHGKIRLLRRRVEWLSVVGSTRAAFSAVSASHGE